MDGCRTIGTIVLTIGMNNVAATLTVRGVTNNEFGLTILGGIGNGCRLESTIDMKSWTPIHHFILTNPIAPYYDSFAPGARFYRVVTPDVSASAN